MALPTMAAINTAVDNVYAALTAARRLNRRNAVESLGRILPSLRAAYAPDVNLTVTDATNADLAAFFAAAGQLGVAFTATNKPLEVGMTFSVNGTGDTTDNALAGAKGGAVADTDIFEITNTGTPAVVYLGQEGDLDFDGEVGPDL